MSHNPQAFPSKIYEDTGIGTNIHEHQGMTLRDYFAGQALVGLSQRFGDSPRSEESISLISYTIADAMLKERAK